MCMFFAFCRSSSLQNADSCACYCQNSCWSRVGPVTPLNLCTEQQANRFQSAHGQFKRFQEHHNTTGSPACRAQWHNAPLLERPGKKLRNRNSFMDQHRNEGYDLFTPFVTNISQAQLQKASFGLPEAWQTNIKLKLPIRQLRTCFLDVSQDVFKTKRW